MTVNDDDSLYFENYSNFRNRDKNVSSDYDLENLIFSDPLYPLVQMLTSEQ